MQTSQSGLMKQIRRVLFPGEGENNENHAPQLAGGCLANLTVASKPKSRRGQRQKWNRHDSDRVSSNDASVLADIHTMSQRNSSRVEHAEGGLLSLFATSATEKENPHKVKRNRNDSVVTSSLLGAVRIDNRNSQSQKSNKQDHARRSRQQVEQVDLLQRTTVSRSDAASLVPKIQSSNISVLVAKPDVRSRRKESVHNVKEDIASVPVAPPQKYLDNTGWPMASGDAAQARKIYQAIALSQKQEKEVSLSTTSLKALKRKKTRMNSDAITSSLIEFTASSKADEDDAFTITEDLPESDSETKPTKRKDTRPTPSKLATHEANVADLMNAIDSMALTSTMEDEKEDQTKPIPRLKPRSRVLEVEYIPVSLFDLLRMEEMTEADSDVIMETNEQEMRRTSRRQVQTDRFSPSLAMKQAQLKAIKSSSESRDRSISFSALSQSGKVTNADDTKELVEPVKRRSGRRQIQTDMFSPSVAMKKAQLKVTKVQDESKPLSSKAKIPKSILRKKQRHDLPPKSRPQVTMDVPSPNPSNDSHEPDAVEAMQLVSPLSYLSQKMQEMQASRNERHEQEKENATSEKQASSGSDLSNKMRASHVSMNTEAVSNEARSEVWNDKQLLQLQQWQSLVNPTSSNFWVEIAEHVGGKSAQECSEKWFSLVKTPGPRGKRVAKNDINRNVPAAASATLHTSDEDDIFNSTPLRGTLFPNDTKSLMESEETKSINFDVGSPILMSARRDRRVCTEYDDGSAITSLQQKVGYKSYLMGLKRGVAQAKKDKKVSKKKQNQKNGTARNMTESVGNGDVSLKCKLSPGGTLHVENLTEVEDDFMYCSSDSSDCDE